MIRKMSIHNVASFAERVDMQLKNVNIVFGANGTGKTTISRVIENHNQGGYDDCDIQWHKKVDAHVYNKDFISRNFNEKSQVPGVYTLGEKSTEIEERIDEKTQEKEKINQEIDQLNDKVQKCTKKLNRLKSDFESRVWDETHNYRKNLKKALRGPLNSKERFLSFVKDIELSSDNLDSFDALQSEYDVWFAKSTPVKRKQASLLSVQTLEEIESNNLLGEVITGQKDNPIAKLIRDNKNDDWVHKGMNYVSGPESLCPFCQRKLNDTIFISLRDYFDEDYEKKLQTLETMRSSYLKNIEELMGKIDGFVQQEKNYQDVSELQEMINDFILITQNNQQKITKKIDHPNEKVTLTDSKATIDAINGILVEMNTSIDKHNSDVDNIKDKREDLSRRIEQRLRFDVKGHIDDYENEIKKANKDLRNQVTQKKEKMTEAEKITQAIKDLRKEITDIGPTIDSINNILWEFGFTNFSLKQDDNRQGYYKVVRSDGTLVKETLSEGEIKFISFLYFYHMLEGTLEKDQTKNDCVVVIDDPVSSLDSAVLFIVSTLIRNLIEQCLKGGETSVKQLILLSHNVYFHNAITRNFSRKKKKDQNKISYFIISKIEETSNLNEYTENPIQSTYDLLWKSVRNCKHGDSKEKTYQTSAASVLNNMRRILEFYLSHICDCSLNELTKEFQGEEKLIYQALTKYLHEGSHNVFDDFDVSLHGLDVKKCVGVFERTFKLMGHSDHCRLMMHEHNN